MALSIFSRYLAIPTIEVDGVVSLAQRPVPAPGTYPDVLRHTIVGAQLLDELARIYYGDSSLWWVIADANEPRFPLDWKPGDSLIIPPLESVRR